MTSQEAIFAVAYRPPRLESAPKLAFLELEDSCEVGEGETLEPHDYLKLCEECYARFAEWLGLDSTEYSFESDRSP
jgi:hypothetical protein